MNQKLLTLLAAALRDVTVLPDFPFDMWATDRDLPAQNYCVCGFAFEAGISKDDSLFDADLDDMDERRWVVSWFWKEFDNTRLGAAKRIEYLLEHGAPPGFDNMKISEEFAKLYQ